MIFKELTLFTVWCWFEVLKKYQKRAAYQTAWNRKNPEKVAKNNAAQAAYKKAWDAAHYANHTKSRLAKSRRWFEKNREKWREYQRTYSKLNRERINKQRYKIRARRIKLDPSLKLIGNLRRRLNKALRASRYRSESIRRFLGCTVEQFKCHLESQFQPGWTWENWGKIWEIDHIKPCASFDLSDPAQRLECFHFSNQRPLSSSENRRKGAKILT